MTDRAAKRAVLIAGPTASGKSALALTLAEALGGTIINADATQVYRDLRILSARPSPAEEARVPHLLFGRRDGAVAWSAAARSSMPMRRRSTAICVSFPPDPHRLRKRASRIFCSGAATGPWHGPQRHDHQCRCDAGLPRSAYPFRPTLTG